MIEDLNVRLSREIRAPREAVFAAWLDPVTLGEFLKPAPGVELAEVAVDAREGGTFGLTMVVGETRIPIRGIYQRINRFDELAFSWSSSRTLETSFVTLTFEEIEPMRTRLTLTHVGFPDRFARNDHDRGWNRILVELDRVLARA